MLGLAVHPPPTLLHSPLAPYQVTRLPALIVSGIITWLNTKPWSKRHAHTNALHMPGIYFQHLVKKITKQGLTKRAKLLPPA